MLNEELPAYTDGAKKHHLPSAQKFNRFVEFILVIQGSTPPDETYLNKIREKLSIRLVYTPIKSTSHARNLGIRILSELEKTPENVIFLDSDSFITSDSWSEIIHISNQNLDEIHEIEVKWEGQLKPAEFKFINTPPSRRIKWQNRMFRTYLWTLLIPTHLIIQPAIRFNEKIGPGENTILKSGEDTIFLLDLFQRNKIKDLIYHSDLHVQHPSRPLDNSKRLTYALGQGNLFRVLIANTTDKTFFVYLLGWLTLFLGNTLFMLITFKPNALAIAKMRLKGLLFNMQQGKQIS